jgi:hypothetical protein
MDRDGYGYTATERGIDRLLTDARTLSPVGIERVAWGWDRHEDPAALERFHEAEKLSLKAVEAHDLGQDWERVRRTVLDLTEGRSSLQSWKVEHGEIGHKAERAMLGAALGIVARELVDHRHYAALVRSMAEALPWLLPEEPPSPSRR